MSAFDPKRTRAPIGKFKTPALDLVGPIPYPALQSMFDALYPPGHQWYWKADFVRELRDDAIALHIKHGAMLPTMQSTMHPTRLTAKHALLRTTQHHGRTATRHGRES